MTDARWLTPEERKAWLALLSVMTVLPGALDAQLQRAARITLFDYTVLAMLSEAHGRALPMTELAARTSSSLSRLSHVVTKLGGRGWVERQSSPGDGRVTTASITQAGMDAIVSLAPDHVENVRQLVFDTLEEGDVEDLRRIGERIVAGLDPKHWILRPADQES
ncbi:MarR family transcriptional regulator [Paenarthrobacter sp. DKR-5]|uniref:MarR family winged helix-turn-helix transcriptional regulator n=1 Tax=Paenarthrobacter sp. DKR-5 TaxID=2835535 RepID=UPI001BDD4463|nr:MarR family transcriptional regulator [Paenarthrobacter sp. DKR-5]MBT1001482.1 MarR family transcriptional regulator [Paenarthrobacter sp. DKR-5]